MKPLNLTRTELLLFLSFAAILIIVSVAAILFKKGAGAPSALVIAVLYFSMLRKYGEFKTYSMNRARLSVAVHIVAVAVAVGSTIAF